MIKNGHWGPRADIILWIVRNKDKEKQVFVKYFKQDESEPASLKLENTNKKSNTNEILIQAKKFLLKIKLCY